MIDNFDSLLQDFHLIIIIDESENDRLSEILSIINKKYGVNQLVYNSKEDGICLERIFSYSLIASSSREIFFIECKQQNSGIPLIDKIAKNIDSLNNIVIFYIKRSFNFFNLPEHSKICIVKDLDEIIDAQKYLLLNNLFESNQSLNERQKNFIMSHLKLCDLHQITNEVNKIILFMHDKHLGVSNSEIFEVLNMKETTQVNKILNAFEAKDAEFIDLLDNLIENGYTMLFITRSFINHFLRYNDKILLKHLFEIEHGIKNNANDYSLRSWFIRLFLLRN